jgi:hypothetical protein
VKKVAVGEHQMEVAVGEHLMEVAVGEHLMKVAVGEHQEVGHGAGGPHTRVSEGEGRRHHFCCPLPLAQTLRSD